MGAGRALTNESPSVAFIGITIACIIISQALAYATSLADHWPGTVSFCALLAIGLQWLVFVPSAALATEKFFDVTGSATYFVLALYSLIHCGKYYTRQIVVTLFVMLWSVRLGSFLYMRIQRAGKDGRFDEIKNNVPRFFNMWTIQGLWAFLTALPVFCINATKQDTAFPTWTDYTGIICFGLGFACEVIADNQKTKFALDPANEDKWISSGLWAYSRHPNYFGEIVLWIGIFLIGASVFTGGQWIAVESPLFVAFLLKKVSGIPLLESRADAKWGQDPGYQTYKASTPELVPYPVFLLALISSLGAMVGMGGVSARHETAELSESLMADEESPQPMVEKPEMA